MDRGRPGFGPDGVGVHIRDRHLVPVDGASPRGYRSQMVATGARAASLSTLLERCGYRRARTAPPAPRFDHLSITAQDRVRDVYFALGGSANEPVLRPGAWDLAFDDGLVVELDEELHFNRYRATTLTQPWANVLRWCEDYLDYAVACEPACLAAARWGKRWTNPPCERMFGPADPPGTFGSVGAPRWKQRALYDAIKDIACLDRSGLQLVRLATVDFIGSCRLQDLLTSGPPPKLDALRELVDRRRSGT